MPDFVGRRRELAWLGKELRAVEIGGEHPGRCVLLRGRRRVGKSRLVEVFQQRAGAPSLFYAASGVSLAQELGQFAAEILASSLPGRDLFTGVTLQTWEAALRLLAQALPDDAASVIVLDELPYLVAADPGFEGTLQQAWDRQLSRKPVLLILIGSDLSMMEALDTYGRPFHQRGKAMALDPLTPSEVGAMLTLKPAQAFDAYLITGGLPLVCAQWPPGMDAKTFLREALSDPTSALLVSAQRSLAAEFPAQAHARVVLSAIGSGERSYTSIRRATSEISQSSLTRALELLIKKRVVAAERPLSTRPSKETRYRIADPYLRFWLYFLGSHLDEVDRGRGDRIEARIRLGWTSWRGRAIEPMVREALARLLPDDRTPWLDPANTTTIGGYWTRNNDVEIDVVAVDRTPVARHIGFVGSIKWLENAEFNHRDVATLHIQRSRLPGATDQTPLIAVSRVATEVATSPSDGIAARYEAKDLIAAWP